MGYFVCMMHPNMYAFLRHCETAGLAKNTISAYTLDLKALYSHLGDRCADVASVTSADIGSHIAWLTCNGCSASTIKRHLATISAWLKFHGRDKDVEIEVPQQGTRLPKPISEEGIRKMMEQELSVRDRLVLELLYCSGLRASEVHTARFEGDLLWVEGKGGVKRCVPCSEYVKKNLPVFQQAYMSGTGLALGEKVEVVPLPVSRFVIYRIVQDAAAAVGIEASPHQLRHSFATHLLLGGCPINAIQQMMGHESMITTAGYMALDMRAKREAIEKLPRRKSVEFVRHMTQEEYEHEDMEDRVKNG